MSIRLSVIPDQFANQFSGPPDTQLGSSIQHPLVPSHRVHAGVVRFTNGNAEAETTGVTKHQEGPQSGTPGGGVAATFTDRHGKPSVLLVPGQESSRTNVETAVRMGLVRLENGRYVDVVTPDGKPATLVQEQASQEIQADPGAEFFYPNDDADWAHDIEPIPQHAHDAAVASMVNVIAHDTGSFEDTAKALAVNAGIDPTLAADYVQSGRVMFQQVVDRAMAKEGLTGSRLDEAYEAMRKDPRQLQQALQGLLHGRDVSGFVALARDFKRSSPGDLKPLQAAGFETHVDQVTGDVLVKRPGGDWRKASDLK